MPITLEQLEIVDVDHSKYDLSPYDFGDSDLNDFVKNDCLKFKSMYLSHTKLALLSGAVVGYITLLADSITLETSERQWLLQKNVTVQHIPALKIGRLGIHKPERGKDIGTALMRYSIGVASRINLELNVGCRFLTVDSYQDSIRFYEKMGFTRSLSRQNKKRTHPSMYYDILQGPQIGQS